MATSTSNSTSKKTAKKAPKRTSPKPGTTPADRRLLARAKRDSEAQVIRLEAVLADMLMRGADGLDEALGMFLDAQSRVEHAPSEKALAVLFKLRDIRQIVLGVAEQMPAFGKAVYL